ncbi:MAG: hypothetical protein P4M14_00005, partial [Gammaproteobacteria bacterium]|nr:hypothetical protein [Gammaproteobacteria bacterium]
MLSSLCKKIRWRDRGPRITTYLLLAIMGVVWLTCSNFPFVTEDEGINFRLGILGDIWPDAGVVWIVAIKFFSSFASLADMRYVMTGCVIGFVLCLYFFVRDFAGMAVAFVTAMAILMGDDVLLNLHKVRPEAFIALSAGGALLFLRHLANKALRGDTITLRNAFVTALFSFLFFHIHMIGGIFVIPLWLGFLLIVWRSGRSPRAIQLTWVVSLFFLAAAILGAIPYLSIEALGQIKNRITSVPLYSHDNLQSSILSQIVATVWNNRGDNLGELAIGLPWFLAPELLRRLTTPLAAFCVVLVSFQIIPKLVRFQVLASKTPEEFKRLVLQVFCVSLFGCFVLLEVGTNRTTNYYMSLVLPFGVVCAATLLGPCSREWWAHTFR